MKMTLKNLAWMVLFLVMNIANAGQLDTNAVAKEHIIQAIKMQWDQPQHPVSVPVVAISVPYAVADWTQDARGGRALLKLNDRHWQALACGDAQIKSVFKLEKMGVPKAHAEEIVQQLTLEETQLSQAAISTINSFSGVVDLLTDPEHHHQHPQ